MSRGIIARDGQEALTEGVRQRWGSLTAIVFALILGGALTSCQPGTLGEETRAQTLELPSPSINAVSFTGRVVGVTDGDTITVLVDGAQQVKVRLAEIDAPERAQPWGNRSKQALSGLVFGRNVSVLQTDIDRWGRIIGQVRVDGLDVNYEMIASGEAWAFRQYLSDQTLIEVEADAKRERRGLWSMPEAQTVPPWDWRRGTRVVQVDRSPPLSAQRSLLSQGAEESASDFTCGAKSRCGQMRSCKEAHFYLTQCGVQALDGNRDGEPCETLCGTAGR